MPAARYNPSMRVLSSLDSLATDVRPDLVVALGCPPRSRNGRPSGYLIGRVRAVAAAYHALGGVPILCSGRGEDMLGSARSQRAESEGRDEVEALAALLVAANVPREALLFDRRAQRTIDTIDHLADRHPGARIVLVSQPFHLPRVLYLARSRRLDAWGLPAPGPTPGPRGQLREGLGRLRAVWDVAISQPRR